MVFVNIPYHPWDWNMYLLDVDFLWQMYGKYTIYMDVFVNRRYKETPGSVLVRELYPLISTVRMGWDTCTVGSSWKEHTFTHRAECRLCSLC